MKKITLLKADVKSSVLDVLGMAVDGKVEDVRIKVNGVDITENIVLSEVEIVLVKGDAE